MPLQQALDDHQRHLDCLDAVKETGTFILTVDWLGLGSCTELDSAVAQIKKLAVAAVDAAEGGWTPGADAAWAAEARDLVLHVGAIAAARLKLAKDESIKGWTEWVDQALADGAGATHRLTDVQRPWVPPHRHVGWPR